MTANLYTIEDLLVGKYYRSNTLEGEIVSAEKDPRATFYGMNTESYLVEVGSDRKVRTVAVKLGDE